jgi:ethanolamine permease
MSNSQPGLKKVLRPIHLWSIAVGLVISGEYFGWSYGWGVSGTVGFLISTLIVTLLYITLVFSFTELTTAIPQSGGPFAYGMRAFGHWGGFLAGFSTVVEFVFAPPAIAFALGSYLHFLHPEIPAVGAAIAAYLVFVGINLLGIQWAARFELVVTLLAVIELCIFIGFTAPHFKMSNFMTDPLPFGWSGVFAAIPFAIWFFLAIEGVAMAAEEADDPKRTIPIGYITGIATLVVLALGVMLCAGGVGDWKQLATRDYPLPEAMAMVLTKDSPWVKMLAGIGMFGLIASLNGIILGYSRQLYALARAGFLPEVLAVVSKKFRAPYWSLLAGAVVGVLCLFSGRTSELITISAMGAVTMYMVAMASLFKLRKDEPKLARPFKAPLYPWFPGIAFVLSAVSLVAMVWYNRGLAAIYLGMLVVAAGAHALRGPRRLAKLA